MLTPFLVLWPISRALGYCVAYPVASAAHDRELEDNLIVFPRSRAAPRALRSAA